MTRTTGPRRATRHRQGGRRGLTVAGALCLVIALGLLAWTVWDLVLRPPVDPEAAAQEVAALRADWAWGAAAPTPAASGEAFAVLRVPELGDDEWPVLVGTDPATLARGVGWYEGTSEPGEVGNLGVAAHGGLNGPFAGLVHLVAGAEVVVETRDAVHTYALTNDPGRTAVADTDTWVLQPVPGQPETRPTEALITLTTTREEFRSPDRVVAFGTLVGSQPRQG